MPSAAYFRRQATTSAFGYRSSPPMRRSQIALILMAEEYKARAVAIEAASESAPAEVNPAEKEPGRRVP
jgi:hypothetical protein